MGAELHWSLLLAAHRSWEPGSPYWQERARARLREKEVHQPSSVLGAGNGKSREAQ